MFDFAWCFKHIIFGTEIASGMNKDEQSFRNLSLSFRGAERQSPTVLQMALRFSRVMERQADTMAGNTEARLKKVIGQFNESPGLHVKHQIDSDKERTILNLLIGTTKDKGSKLASDLICCLLLKISYVLKSVISNL